MTITLYFLQASRCIRTAWLLEALQLEYNVKFADRVDGKAPAEMKKEAGGLGKFPTLVDDGTFIYESGNITEYLCDVYDKEHKLLPAIGDKQRYQVLQWLHASEATYALHGLAVLYSRWFQKGGDQAATEEGLGGNVIKDLDHFEEVLAAKSTRFLFSDQPSAADISMHFSLVFILKRELGTKGKHWSRVEKYIEDCESTESYKKAVEKTGHKL